MKLSKIFSDEEKKRIVDAIAKIESTSSAEVRVHIESKCPASPVDNAVRAFSKLKMHKTRDKNGVLLYIAVNSKKCAIVGDEGINKNVDKNFWDLCCEKMLLSFKNNNYCQGIVDALGMAGVELTKHFPIREDDTNELSNEISFGK
ncbi:MAG: TPM domain-containing protein [Bacteroidetes bacterium]|nr:TPM domain-containing protein [Bacteroidota bacterium]